MKSYSLKSDFKNLLNQIQIKTNENKLYIKDVQKFLNANLDESHKNV